MKPHRCSGCYKRLPHPDFVHVCATPVPPATPKRPRSTTKPAQNRRRAAEPVYSHPFSIQPLLDHQQAERAAAAERCVVALEVCSRVLSLAREAGRSGDLDVLAFHLGTVAELCAAALRPAPTPTCASLTPQEVAA